MSMDRTGWPFVLAGLVPAIGAAWLGWRWTAVLFAVLAACMALFFRDPSRTVPADPGAVVSPADGKVMIAGDVELNAAPPGDWKQISIFLSPLDVHINRIPVSGRVTRIEYKRGAFLAAFRPDAAVKNERNEVWIDHDGQTVVVRQVVGVVARRLVCRIGEGAQVQAGDKYGLMKFGSRIDLFLPRSVALTVAVGQRVRGGETVLARWP
jgi:phosphatidylserine decarboxylase